MIGCQTERGDRPGELVLRRPAGVAGRVKLVLIYKAVRVVNSDIMLLSEIITWTRYLNTTEFRPALRMAPHLSSFRALAAFTFRTRNLIF